MEELRRVGASGRCGLAQLAVRLLRTTRRLFLGRAGPLNDLRPRWRLTSSNGQTIASAGESYANRSNAKRAAAAFRANAAKAEFEVCADSTGKHRWRAKARNGQIVATGGEAFGSHSSAKRAATNVQNNVRDAAVAGPDAPKRGGREGRSGRPATR